MFRVSGLVRRAGFVFVRGPVHPVRVPGVRGLFGLPKGVSVMKMMALAKELQKHPEITQGLMDLQKLAQEKGFQVNPSDMASMISGDHDMAKDPEIKAQMIKVAQSLHNAGIDLTQYLPDPKSLVRPPLDLGS